MQVKAHPFSEEDLAAYLDGELSLNESELVEEHLAACGECRGVVEDLKHVSRGLQAWKAPALRPGWGAPVAGQMRKSMPWRGLAVAAGLVVLFGLGIQLRHESAKLYAPTEVAQRLEQPKTSLPDVQQEFSRSVRMAQEPSILTKQLLVARAAEMAITVEHLDAARERLEQIARSHGGYIGDLTTSGATDQGRSLSATLRIPAPQLTGLFADLKSLGEVDKESQRNEEVTRQSVDTEARLKNLRETEKRLTAILQDRTGKLSDVLQVEEQIARVRNEIETAEAEQKALSNRVALASVHVTMTERYRKQVGTNHSALPTRLRNAALEGFESLAGLLEGVVVFLLSCGPVLLVIFAALFWPGKWVWKKLRDTA